MSSRFWEIKGFDGHNKIFETKVAFGVFSADRLKLLLKVLAAKVGLEFAEIVGAFAKRRTKISNSLLEVQRDDESGIYTCGENPYFIARAVDEHGNPTFRGRKRQGDN